MQATKSCCDCTPCGTTFLMLLVLMLKLTELSWIWNFTFRTFFYHIAAKLWLATETSYNVQYRNITIYYVIHMITCLVKITSKQQEYSYAIIWKLLVSLCNVAVLFCVHSRIEEVLKHVINCPQSGF